MVKFNMLLLMAAGAMLQIGHVSHATPGPGPVAIVPAGAQPELLREGGTWLEGPAELKSRVSTFPPKVDPVNAGRGSLSDMAA